MAEKLKEVDDILDNQDEQLKKLHDIVNKAFTEEALIIDNLAHPPRETLTRGQQISDRVARFGGSWTFIIFFSVLLFIWVLYNSLIPRNEQFDPYPFILMNLILSCVAAMQAPIIMMSQNRQEEKDRNRAENDYLINMKAELEVRSLHQKMDLLLEEQIKTLFEVQAKQLELLKKLTERVDSLCAKNNI
jgi:uncharacterized membrane protein